MGDDDFRDNLSGISELPPSTIDYVNEYLSDDNSNGDVPDGFAPYPNIPFDASPNIGPIQFPPAAAPILNGDDNDFLSDVTSRAAPDFLSDITSLVAPDFLSDVTSVQQDDAIPNIDDDNESISSAGTTFERAPSFHTLPSGRSYIHRDREDRARERIAYTRNKRDTKLMLHRLKGRLPRDLRLPMTRYPNEQGRTNRWRALLKAQSGKGFGIDNGSSRSSDSESDDDAGTLGYNYRVPPTFEDSSDYEDDYFETPKDNFFPVPNKYRLGPKKTIEITTECTLLHRFEALLR